MGNDIQDAFRKARGAVADLFNILRIDDSTDPQYAEKMQSVVNNESIVQGAFQHLNSDINRLWSPTTGTTPKETVPEPEIVERPTKPRPTSSAKPKEKPKNKRR